MACVARTPPGLDDERPSMTILVVFGEYQNQIDEVLRRQGDIKEVQVEDGPEGQCRWAAVTFYDIRSARGARSALMALKSVTCDFVHHASSDAARTARIKRLGNGSKESTVQWFEQFGALESVLSRKGGDVEAVFFDARAAEGAMKAHQKCVDMLSALRGGAHAPSAMEVVH
mmetsp:Transcript_55213/g.121036  ORF Transcript_55213/g.121036 Transcript_55213/m.121036 type:complete len:172 (+) Transcript_55213:39-554(+)